MRGTKFAARSKEQVIALYEALLGKKQREVKQLKSKLEEKESSLNVLQSILDTDNEGVIVVDKDGYILKFNRAYEEFLGIKEKDILGKHVTDVIENTRMHIVARTGELELGQLQKLNGHEMIANRIPISKDGEVVGAVGKVLFKDVEELKSLMQRVDTLESKLNYYKSQVQHLQEAKYSFDNIITQNKKMEYLKKVAVRAADSISTVLIQGESGTGKELFAHAIHKASHRKYGPFIRVNCAAIPKELLEAELFGYEEGAFTGAKKEGKPGKFELANGGTIFLDEIGSMPTEMQVKLLRVLQEREFERIGGNKIINLDARIIAATNENLEEEVKRGNFREDLYYRLNVIRLDIPPLRDRLDDIPLLAESILKGITEELYVESKELSTEALNRLQEYNWPGNVRELHNFIERAVNLTQGEIISPGDLPDVLQGEGRKGDTLDQVVELKEIVKDAEVEAIGNALKKTNGNRTEAAKLLGIHRTSLYQKLDKYDIDISEL